MNTAPASLQTTRITVIEPDKRHQQSLGRVLKAIADEVVLTDDFSDPALLSEADLAVINYDNLAPSATPLLAGEQATPGKRRPHILLYSSKLGNYQTVFEHLQPPRLTNVLANNQGVDGVELLVTAQKILRQDIFGIEKYFCWGVKSLRIPIVKSSQKDDLVDQARQYASNFGINPHLISLYCMAVEEFVSNALYAAPQNEQGQPRYAHLPRTAAITLDPSERVQVTLCCDGSTLGVAITDPFGALTAEQTLASMARYFRDGQAKVNYDTPGAGIGFLVSYDSVSRFVINLSPGKRTEVIGLLDVRKGYRHFSSQSKSFHIFVEGVI
jgi:hypothetical protein